MCTFQSQVKTFSYFLLKDEYIFLKFKLLEEKENLLFV